MITLDDLSRLCIGTWAWSNNKWWGHQPDRDSESVIVEALQRDLNFIDTAPAYGRGHAESLLGNFLDKNDIRDRFFIATKLGLRWEGRGVHHDLAPKRMQEELALSLERLKTDWIDLYQVHWPDPETSLQATAEQMRMFFETKKIRYVGVSNFNLEQLKEWQQYCPLHFFQPPFSMIDRLAKRELFDYCLKNELNVITYDTLSAGVLTGKYLNQKPPKDFRRKFHKALAPEQKKITDQLVSSLENLAKELNIPLSVLVIRWTMQQPGVFAPIVGLRNQKQCIENAGALDVSLDTETIQLIDDLISKYEAQIIEKGKV